MSKYRLYLGPQQQEVDLSDTSSVSLSAQLKDHENLGKRKASTLSGLKIVKNNKADKVLPSYFHVNSTLDAHSGIDGLLTYNGVELMKGKVYFKAISDTEFTCDLVNGIGSLAITLGDDLIKGNNDASKDTKVDSTITDYSFVMNRDAIRAYQRGTNVNRPYAFPLVNYDGNRSPISSRSEYPFYPAIQFKKVIEAILENAGVEYVIDPSIMADLNQMYMPYNGPRKVLVGNDNLSVTTLRYDNNPALPRPYTPETNLEGHEKGLTPFLSTEADNITKKAAGTKYVDYYPIPADGDYVFQFQAYGVLADDVVIVAPNPPYLPQPYSLKFSIAYLKSGSADWKTASFDPIEVNTKDRLLVTTNKLTITGLTEGDKIALIQNDAALADDKKIESKFLVLGKDIYGNPVDPSLLTIEASEYIYSGKVCTLDDILPRQYKKKDAIKDFMTMFNLYMISDHGVIKFIKYDKYLDKTKPPVDLTDKVDMKVLSIEDMVNRVPSNTVFTYTGANDKLSTDFKDKLGVTFGEGKYSIDGKITETSATTTMTTLDTVIQKDADMVLPYAHIIKDKLTTEDKPRILYLNVRGITQTTWGSDAHGFGADLRFSKVHFLSTEGLSGSLLFDNRYTYIEGNTRATNSTLLNRYYKAELDHISDPSTKVVNTLVYLDDAYMRPDYMKRIYYIDLGQRGTFYGYINKMSGYSPDTGKAKVEFISIPNDTSYGQYPSRINTNLISYTPTDEGDQLSSSSASGTSSSGSSSTGNYYTKDEVNSKFLPLVGGTVTGDTIFNQAVTIHGNLRVLGIGTTVDLQTLEIESNELILNHNLGYTDSPYSGLSGVRVNRGNQPDYLFQYDEISNLFKIGKQANLQAVATRQDDPLDNTIPYWSKTNRMYMSSGITYQHGTFVDNAGGYFYNSNNSNKEYIPWYSQKVMVGDGKETQVIQVKHLNGAYGNVLKIDSSRRLLFGDSGVTQGVSLFHGNKEVAKTISGGFDILGTLYAEGDVVGRRFYSASDNLADLNTIGAYDRGLQVFRYSLGAANKPFSSNNANAVINIMSHAGGYGKQLAFGDSDDLYIRRVSAGAFKTWHKIYHDGNANRSTIDWNMKNANIHGAITAQGAINGTYMTLSSYIKAKRFYTGASSVQDLNNMDIYDRGIQVYRYQKSANNNPVTINDANALVNIMSFAGGYGKQLAFGDNDDLYIRTVSSNSYRPWRKLYHDGNANSATAPWKASFLRVQDQVVIRGTTTNDRLQLWGSQPYISFWRESVDARAGYIKSSFGNMILNVDDANDAIQFKTNETLQAYVSNSGLNVPDGNQYKALGKTAASWGKYDSRYTAQSGALDVQMSSDSGASWIWSARDHANTFKAGFQVSTNSNYSQLYLSPRLKVTAWDSNFEFYADGVKVAQLDKDGNLRVKGTVQAHAL